MRSSPVVLIIDPVAPSLDDLAGWLGHRQEWPEVIAASSVAVAVPFLRMERIEWLFIRVSAWNDFQQVALFLSHPPSRVVFLSGLSETCNWHVPEMAGVHVLLPTTGHRLSGIWERLSAPGYESPPLDFFFLHVEEKYVAVRYRDLRQVHCQRGRLLVFTRGGVFPVKESLSRFESRLPMVLEREGTWLVNGGYKD